MRNIITVSGSDNSVTVSIDPERIPDNISTYVKNVVLIKKKLDYNFSRTKFSSDLMYNRNIHKVEYEIDNDILSISLTSYDLVKIKLGTGKLMSFGLQFSNKDELLKFLVDVSKVFESIFDNNMMNEYLLSVMSGIDLISNKSIRVGNEFIMVYDNFTIIYDDLLDVIKFVSKLDNLNWNNTMFLPVIDINGRLTGIFDSVNYIPMFKIKNIEDIYGSVILNEIIDEIEKLCETNSMIKC